MNYCKVYSSITLQRLDLESIENQVVARYRDVKRFHTWFGNLFERIIQGPFLGSLSLPIKMVNNNLLLLTRKKGFHTSPPYRTETLKGPSNKTFNLSWSQ
jgi:hypothetical protein